MVLKLLDVLRTNRRYYVAIALTVYGIETRKQKPKGFVQLYVATAPTVYGIETFHG